MTALGIDLGQRVAWVEMDDRLRVGTHDCQVWQRTNGQRWTREKAKEFMRDLLDGTGMTVSLGAAIRGDGSPLGQRPDIVVCEQAWLNHHAHGGRRQNPEPMLAMADMATVLAEYCGSVGVRFESVDPKLVGQRIAPKAQRVEYVTLYYNWPGDWPDVYLGPRGGRGVTQDVADAACLAQYGHVLAWDTALRTERGHKGGVG